MRNKLYLKYLLLFSVIYFWGTASHTIKAQGIIAFQCSDTLTEIQACVGFVPILFNCEQASCPQGQTLEYCWWRSSNGTDYTRILNANDSIYQPPAASIVTPGNYYFKRCYTCDNPCDSAQCTEPLVLTIVNKPSAPALSAKFPDLDSICQGTDLWATFSAGMGGLGCKDTFQYRFGMNGIWLPYIPGDTIKTAGVSLVEIRAGRSMCTPNRGCDASPWNTVRWVVVPVPTPPQTIKKTPDTNEACVNASLSLDIRPGTGGVNCQESYFYQLGNGPWLPYQNKDVIQTSNTETVRIRGQRGPCAAGSNCATSRVDTLATWQIVPPPMAPSLDQKIPYVNTVCEGTKLIMWSNAGSGGAACTDQYRFVDSQGVTRSYTPGDSITAGGDRVVIEGRRANCAAGSNCLETTWDTLAVWEVVKQPVVGNVMIDPGGPGVCAGVQVRAGVGASSGGGAAAAEAYAFRYGSGSYQPYTLGNPVETNDFIDSGGTVTFEAIRSSTITGCRDDRKEATVSVYPLPKATLQAVDANDKPIEYACQDTEAYWRIEGSNGKPPYVFNANKGMDIENIYRETISTLDSGMFFFNVSLIEDAYQCRRSYAGELYDSIRIHQNPEARIDFVKASGQEGKPTLINEAFQLKADGSRFFVPANNLYYNWTFDPGLLKNNTVVQNSTQSVDTFIVVNTETFIQLALTDNFGCKNSKSDTLSVSGNQNCSITQITKDVCISDNFKQSELEFRYNAPSNMSCIGIVTDSSKLKSNLGKIDSFNISGIKSDVLKLYLTYNVAYNEQEIILIDSIKVKIDDVNYPLSCGCSVDTAFRIEIKRNPLYIDTTDFLDLCKQDTLLIPFATEIKGSNQRIIFRLLQGNQLKSNGVASGLIDSIVSIPIPALGLDTGQYELKIDTIRYLYGSNTYCESVNTDRVIKIKLSECRQPELRIEAENSYNSDSICFNQSGLRYQVIDTNDYRDLAPLLSLDSVEYFWEAIKFKEGLQVPYKLEPGAIVQFNALKSSTASFHFRDSSLLEIDSLLISCTIRRFFSKNNRRDTFSYTIYVDTLKIKNTVATDPSPVYRYPGNLFFLETGKSDSTLCIRWGLSKRIGTNYSEEYITNPAIGIPGNNGYALFVKDTALVGSLQRFENYLFADTWFRSNNRCDTVPPTDACITRHYYNAALPPRNAPRSGIFDTNIQQLYPNPSSGEVSLRMLGDWYGTYEWHLYSPTGQQHASGSWTKQLEDQTATILLNGLPPGMYYLHVWNATGRFKTHKLILQSKL